MKEKVSQIDERIDTSSLPVSKSLITNTKAAMGFTSVIPRCGNCFYSIVITDTQETGRQQRICVYSNIISFEVNDTDSCKVFCKELDIV